MKMQPAMRYAEIKTSTPGYWSLLIGLALIALIGFAAAHHMDVEGHHITGMSNQVVWGLPHVFAIFLIVAASGALNLASLASVFGKQVYKPLARFSAPGSPGAPDRGDDALQFQIDICLEHYPLHRFYRHRNGLSMADDGAPHASLEQTGRFSGLCLAPYPDHWYGFYIRFPGGPRSLRLRAAGADVYRHVLRFRACDVHFTADLKFQA
jgi:hypothetical protein